MEKTMPGVPLKDSYTKANIRQRTNAMDTTTIMANLKLSSASVRRKLMTDGINNKLMAPVEWYARNRKTTDVLDDVSGWKQLVADIWTLPSPHVQY